jgi:hypothetical protein
MMMAKDSYWMHSRKKNKGVEVAAAMLKRPDLNGPG